MALYRGLFMNYLRHYIRIVRRSFHSPRYKGDGNYYEGHHVKPKSLGGKRIVLLTAKEHFIAHFLLYKHFKKYGNTNQLIKMSRAFKSMTFSSNDNIKRYTSKSFEYARIAFNESMKGENHPMYGKSHPPELLKKIGESIKNMPKERKDEMRKKQREAKLGTKWTSEHRNNALEGRRKYQESRPPKFEIIMTNGDKHYVARLDRFIIDNNLSRSMVRRYIDNGQVINTSVKSTEKINNTIGIIINTIKE